MIQHRIGQVKQVAISEAEQKIIFAQNKIHLNHCTNDVAAGSSKIMEKMKAVRVQRLAGMALRATLGCK